jgi:hypothetical protein
VCAGGGGDDQHGREGEPGHVVAGVCVRGLLMCCVVLLLMLCCVRVMIVDLLWVVALVVRCVNLVRSPL